MHGPGGTVPRTTLVVVLPRDLQWKFSRLGGISIGLLGLLLLKIQSVLSYVNSTLYYSRQYLGEEGGGGGGTMESIHYYEHLLCYLVYVFLFLAAHSPGIQLAKRV